MILNLKKPQKKENTWKIKKQHFKTETNGNKKKWGKKGTSTREKNGKQMDLSICIFLAFILLSRFVFFCFFCFLFAFCLEKNNNKSKIKAKKKQIEKAKWMQMDKSIFILIFSPFLTFLCFSPFFPFLFCFCVFLILLICFLLFLFFAFVALFFKF